MPIDSHAPGHGHHENLEEEEEEEIYIDELSPEQFQELMKNPQFAALFRAQQTSKYFLKLKNNG
jgi:hypothetical protein